MSTFCRFCSVVSKRSSGLEFIVDKDSNTGLPFACTREHLPPTPKRLRELADHLRNIFGNTVPGVVIFERRRSHLPDSELLPLSDHEKKHAACWWSPLIVDLKAFKAPGVSAGMVTLNSQLNNEIVAVAQKYVGYFHGREVIADPSVWSFRMRVGGKWREPTVVRDDCVFCRNMTDDDVRKRIIYFQLSWEIEVCRANQTLPGYPHRMDYPILEPGKWHEAVERWYQEFKERDSRLPVLSYRFDLLPLRIQRKICIEWNHVWLRWLEKQPELAVFLTRDYGFTHSASDEQHVRERVAEDIDTVLDLANEIQSGGEAPESPP